MLNIIKSKLTLIAVMLLVIGASAGILVSPQDAGAASKDAVCGGFQEALGDGCGGSGGGEEINSTIEDAINILSSVVGVAAVIMIIVAGIKYITASGDPGSIKSARNTVIYAIVGLLIVAVSQTIVKYVVANVVNQN